MASGIRSTSRTTLSSPAWPTISSPTPCNSTATRPLRRTAFISIPCGLRTGRAGKNNQPRINANQEQGFQISNLKSFFLIRVYSRLIVSCSWAALLFRYRRKHRRIQQRLEALIVRLEANDQFARVGIHAGAFEGQFLRARGIHLLEQPARLEQR